jgi:hypothetical protein
MFFLVIVRIGACHSAHSLALRLLLKDFEAQFPRIGLAVDSVEHSVSVVVEPGALSFFESGCIVPSETTNLQLVIEFSCICTYAKMTALRDGWPHTARVTPDI